MLSQKSKNQKKKCPKSYRLARKKKTCRKHIKLYVEHTLRKIALRLQNTAEWIADAQQKLALHSSSERLLV